MQFWFKKGAWASKKSYQVIKGLEPNAIKSIAVIRHTALGDMLLTRPFFVEIKRAFPNAKVTISVFDHYLRGIPEDLVDRIHIVYRESKQKHSLKEKIRNLRALGNHDIIFDLADTSRSMLLCLLNKARLKIGFPYRSLHRYLFYDAVVFRSDFIFEAEQLLHMLSLLGIKTAFPPDFNITNKPYISDSPYIVYFTGASTSSKCWSSGNFKQLLVKMSKDYPGYDHIVLKGIGKWETTSEILEELGGNSNIKSVEINELEKTISFIKGATMLISNDTGIRHIAIAVGTPGIGIFIGVKNGSGPPYRYWPRYGNHEVVYNLSGSEPSPEKVFMATKKIMDHISMDRLAIGVRNDNKS